MAKDEERGGGIASLEASNAPKVHARFVGLSTLFVAFGLMFSLGFAEILDMLGLYFVGAEAWSLPLFGLVLALFTVASLWHRVRMHRLRQGEDER